MRVSRGRIDDYLGTNLDYRTPGESNINMTNYVKKTIKKYPEYFSTVAAKLASDFLLKTNNNADNMKN